MQRPFRQEARFSPIKECMEPGNNKSLLKVIFSRRMLVAFVMGFACGLPLLLTITVLQAWMKEEGADLTVIGMMALAGVPYTVN